MKIETKKAPLVDTRQERTKRERLAPLRVMIADSNTRTAALVRAILFSFGFRTMDVVTSGAEALALLENESFEFIITEWNMVPVDGLELTRAIRQAKSNQRLRNNLPVIMLTAKTQIEHVEAARDAGITEFLAKPFSARTMSSRIIQIIDHPRSFVEVPGYVGPCRRRSAEEEETPINFNRRLPPELRKKLTTQQQLEKISAPDYRLRNKLHPFAGSDLMDEAAIEAAQAALLEAEGEFIEWSKEYIAQLNQAYWALTTAPDDQAALKALSDAAYAITSQAGIFGYNMGTEVGEMLIHYLDKHPQVTDKTLIIIRKHIDTVNTIFTQHIKDNGQEIGADLMSSLQALIEKFG